MGNGGKLVIGMVINTATKPSRDVMLGIMDDVLDRPDVVPRLFHASPATTAKNLIKFIESGVDGLIFCGVRKGIVLSFAKAMPNHPPAVVVTNLAVSEADLEKIGVACPKCGGSVKVTKGQSCVVKCMDIEEAE